ncbi:MAG TPA: hypothetical protein VGM69_01610 [Chloroflexota bacterium]|jgi:hypothetical protein
MRTSELEVRMRALEYFHGLRLLPGAWPVVRVVYAADGAGRVLGRKLIGLTADGKLVGFRTYTVLSRQQGGGALRALFARYLRDFARRCGVGLADAGEVPRLFAEAWYDDGVVPWGGADAGQDPPPITKETRPA